MLIILAVITGIIGVAIAAYDDRHRASKYSTVRTKIIVTSLFVLVICVCGVIIIPNLTYQDKVQTNEYNVLQTVGDEQAIKKNKIANEDTYIFFFQDDDELQKIGDTYVPSIKICNIRADDSTIYEEDIDRPYIIEYTIYTRSRLNDFWKNLLVFGMKNAGASERKTYDIFIPKGTFIGDYDRPIPEMNTVNVSD